MLQSLHVKNLALIDEIEVPFGDGLNILTGETGAGKSIIIGSINLALGAKADKEMIRTGAEYALVELVFTVEKPQQLEAIQQLELPVEDGQIILQRKIMPGRSVCKVCGETVTARQLKQLAEILIDIHGQNEHQELMDPERHLALVDNYQPEILAKLAQYQILYANYRRLSQALEQREKNAHEWAQRLDMLQFQVNEISEAQLHEGEEEELQEQKRQLDNYQTIHHALEMSYQALNGEELDVMSVLGNVMSELEDVAEFNSELAAIYEKVSDAFYNNTSKIGTPFVAGPAV